jgi:murein L,D-transpeptidase YafK
VKKLWLLIGMVIIITAILIWANLLSNPLTNDAHADFILVKKAERKLTLFRKGIALKSYTIALGREPVGKKEKKGDNRTPEGQYTIDSRNNKSLYHKALHISYPNSQDIANAQKKGCSPGGSIYLHGVRKGFGWLGKLHRLINWTRGCIAVTNVEIDEICNAVLDGTRIEIIP